MSKSLGNQKPPHLVRIKMKMWEVIISIALGKVDTESGVLKILNTVNESFVNAISLEERQWFRPTKCKIFL